MEYNKRYGGCWDRGRADAYYRRPRNPHKYVGATGATPRVEMDQLTEEEIKAYNAGYRWQIESGEFKDYG
jgi:hypothetical protein